MLVRCTSTSRVLLPTWRELAPYDQTTFPITEGRSYSVLGMQSTTDSVEYLIHTDTFYPSFVPAVQFSVENPRIPEWWVYRFLGYPSENLYWMPIAEWGYPEMVLEDGHCEAVIDRDPRALAIYTNYLNASRRFDGEGLARGE